MDTVRTVRAIMSDLERCPDATTRAICKARWARTRKDFAEAHPRLFEMVFGGRFEAAQLEFMLDQMARIEDKATFEAGTSNVMQRLNERYVVPVAGLPNKDVDTSKMEHIQFTTSGSTNPGGGGLDL